MSGSSICFSRETILCHLMKVVLNEVGSNWIQKPRYIVQKDENFAAQKNVAGVKLWQKILPVY